MQHAGLKTDGQVFDHHVRAELLGDMAGFEGIRRRVHAGIHGALLSCARTPSSRRARSNSSMAPPFRNSTTRIMKMPNSSGQRAHIRLKNPCSQTKMRSEEPTSELKTLMRS